MREMHDNNDEASFFPITGRLISRIKGNVNAFAINITIFICIYIVIYFVVFFQAAVNNLYKINMVKVHVVYCGGWGYRSKFQKFSDELKKACSNTDLNIVSYDLFISYYIWLKHK